MLRLRRMTDADLPLILRLRAQAGWNQTEADLRRYLALQGDGGLVAEHDGAPVGTTMTFLFGQVGWVAMVLVEASLRGQGIGTALTREAIAILETKGARSIRLDATPLGRPVYEKLGFVPQYTLHRYQGTLGLISALEVAGPGPDDWPAIQSLDQAVTGAERGELLRRLYEEAPDSFRVIRRPDGLAGFVAWRAGHDASLIGPCLAIDERAGESLLLTACRRLSGRRAFIDVPETNRPANAFVRDTLGLEVQRPLLRMVRGEPICDNTEMLWASSGPAKG